MFSAIFMRSSVHIAKVILFIRQFELHEQHAVVLLVEALRQN
jgi:hypothetical protein